MFYTKKHVHMHTIQDLRSCEYTKPPRAFTQMWATTRVKRVDMLYLGAYTGGHYFGWALFQAFTVPLPADSPALPQRESRHDLSQD